MALPVVPVKRPQVLNGTVNGRLPASILVNTPGQAGGYTVRLVEPAARAWRALCAAMAELGHILKPSGPLDSYRPYERQEQEFRERFRTYDTGRRPAVTRSWLGRPWWLLPNVALAAVPGTSNHGLGLAVDVGVELDGDVGPESIAGTAAMTDLLRIAHLYGWSWEVQSEPWHIRYVSGDDIPAAVLAYESALEDDMKLALFQEKDGPAVYLGNGIHRKWVKNEGELADILYLASIGKIGPLADGGRVMVGVADLDAFGVLIGPDPHAPSVTTAARIDVDRLAQSVTASTAPMARTGGQESLRNVDVTGSTNPEGV